MMAPGERRAPRVRIGCAGWSIPSRHRYLFGEGDSHLSRYATRFDVTEINSTFYRPHQSRTFERWAASVPARFRFSLKLPRQITHEARLLQTGDALTRFFDDVSGLGKKLGGVLVQLPPSLAFDARVADRFFGMVRRRCDAPVACEPRHASWFEPGVDALWDRYRVARVAADPARLPAAALPAGARGPARWSYWRWHGSPRIYYSRYDDETLQSLAHDLCGQGRPRSPAWCILDNTAHGHAIEDAARLQDLIHGIMAASSP
ncbi:DUF72 domain-containing protein [Novilysobacter spongiicola]|uniref:Uncharacterized conserved protein YecE, DUF72 family n=1 Tax=Lysobacter spongiicola DSM 21749 TaxID=1122188 RepID=A0A1T4SEE1_9GAMM|nr:DUF72 domain-containing protein [Lysobacter spongiicola]SKA26670.1 Uncharacterized conserved protein YecE, DUF72 family [Lysobacter spongiicola DSM 21749]